MCLEWLGGVVTCVVDREDASVEMQLPGHLSLPGHSKDRAARAVRSQQFRRPDNKHGKFLLTVPRSPVL